MIAKINQLLQEVEALKAANAEELEALRIKYLSKKGAINDLMADFRNVAAEQKKEVGMRLNELKNKAQEKIAALKEQFESQDTGCDDIDLTRSAYPVELGTRHPLSIVRKRNHRYICPYGIQHRRRTGNGRRLARILLHEFCRRPSGTRHAGYILHRK